MINTFKMLCKASQNPVIWFYQETLHLEQDGIKAEVKVKFHVKSWTALTQMWRGIF